MLSSVTTAQLSSLVRTHVASPSIYPALSQAAIKAASLLSVRPAHFHASMKTRHYKTVQNVKAGPELQSWNVANEKTALTGPAMPYYGRPLNGIIRDKFFYHQHPIINMNKAANINMPDSPAYLPLELMDENDEMPACKGQDSGEAYLLMDENDEMPASKGQASGEEYLPLELMDENDEMVASKVQASDGAYLPLELMDENDEMPASKVQASDETYLPLELMDENDEMPTSKGQGVREPKSVIDLIQNLHYPQNASGLQPEAMKMEMINEEAKRAMLASAQAIHHFVTLSNGDCDLLHTKECGINHKDEGNAK